MGGPGDRPWADIVVDTDSFIDGTFALALGENQDLASARAAIQTSVDEAVAAMPPRLVGLVRRAGLLQVTVEGCRIRCAASARALEVDLQVHDGQISIVIEPWSSRHAGYVREIKCSSRGAAAATSRLARGWRQVERSAKAALA